MSRILEFKTGLTYLGRGIKFFTAHKRLWIYAIVPTIINMAVFVLAGFALIHYFDSMNKWLFGGKELAYVLLVLVYIARVLIFIVMMIVAVILALIVSAIFTGWFNEVLSARVEDILLGGLPPDTPGLTRRFWRSAIVEMQKGLFFIMGLLILLLFNIIPVVGSTICFIAIAIFGAFFLGLNFTDYPMNRRLWTFSKRLRIAWSKRHLLTGFGTISLIPVVPFLLSGPLVAGGTILFNEAIKDADR